MYSDLICLLRIMLLNDEIPPLAREVNPSPRLKMLLDMPAIPWKVIEEHSWSKLDKSPHIYILEDQTKCRRSINSSGTDCIRGNVGFTKGTHCWEIRWGRMQRGCYAVVGVATEEAPLSCSDYKHLVGSNKSSWGWDLCSNKLYHDFPERMSRTYPVFQSPEVDFDAPDVFMVILDMDEGTLSFAAHRKNLGVAFTGLQGKKLYPIVNTVFSFCEVTMRYVGGIKRGPPSLKAMCRLLIREKIGKNRIAEVIRTLDIPETLKQYISSSR